MNFGIAPFVRCLAIYHVMIMIFEGSPSIMVWSWSPTTTSVTSKTRSAMIKNVHNSFRSSSSRLAASSSSSKIENNSNNNIDSSSSSSILDRRSMISTAIASAGLCAMALPEPASAIPMRVASTVTAYSNGNSKKNLEKIPTWTLPGNVQFPTLALNTVGLSVDQTERAIEYATKYEIMHIDFHPGKERDGVAKYLANNNDGNNDRKSKLFLNTKIRKAPPGTSPEDAAVLARKQIEEDLGILKVDQVDMLMLRDSPDPLVIQSQWAVLEDALSNGQTRSIGVINYCEGALKAVLATAKVKPAINYYMNHIGMGVDPRGLRSFGEKQGIRTFAYGAVGEPGPNSELLQNTLIKQIADNHNVSPEEVCVRWTLQTGVACSVRPTTDFALGMSMCGSTNSKCDDGLKARSKLFKWKLTKKEMKQLNAITSPNDNPTLFSSTGCPDSFVI